MNIIQLLCPKELILKFTKMQIIKIVLKLCESQTKTNSKMDSI